MIRNKKILTEEHIPEFEESIIKMPEDSKIFVDKSLEIANYIFQILMEKNLKQKDLAERLGKSEAEISKWLTGMHNFTLRSLSKVEAALDATIICTPKHISPSVRVTNHIRMGSVNAKLIKQPNIPPVYGRLVYMKQMNEIKENVKVV